METKNIVIIAILVIVICILVGLMFTMMTKTAEYDRIEITSNGTTIELPSQAEYMGDTNGIRFWNWSGGEIVSYNSQEGGNGSELSGAFGFYAIKELVRAGDSQSIDGFTVYKLNSNQISDNLKLDIDGEYYCIHFTNETTHDNIMICCKDKDVLLHIAKSIEFKTPSGNNAPSKSTAHQSNSISYSNNDKSNDNDDEKKFTQQDLDRARNEGYRSGYDDSFYDSYSESNVETTTDDSSSSSSSSSRSSSSSSNVETTRG